MLQLQEHHVLCFLQIKRKHPIERESQDQILEIKLYHIKSTKYNINSSSTPRTKFLRKSCANSTHNYRALEHTLSCDPIETHLIFGEPKGTPQKIGL